MKLSVWRVLLRGVTVLLAVAVLAGCAGVQQQVNRINNPFYPEYYAAKKLDSDDLVRLRGYASSPDIQVSDAASLIVGHHYLKEGDKTYGEFLINKYYDSPALTDQMKIYAKLWKAESLVANKQMKNAEKLIADIKKMNKNIAFEKTMNTYCSRNGFRIVNSDYNECIDSITKILNPNKSEAVADVQKGNGGIGMVDNSTTYDNLTYEDYSAMQQDNETMLPPILDKDSVINIVEGDVTNDYVQGMIYAISNLGSSYQINSVADSDSNAQKYAVNINSKTKEIKIGSDLIYMGIDWNNLGYITSNLQFIDDYDRIIIASSENHVAVAKNIEQNIKLRGKYTKTINYSEKSFQNRLNNEITRADNATLLMIGIGDETEILSFIPIAKYLQNNTETQRILLLMSAVFDVKKDRAYGNYFKDVYIISPMKIQGNNNLEKISNDYENFFGQKMTSENMMGYDTIKYIDSLLDNNVKPDYLTNISGFINFKAHRTVNLYKYDRLLELTEELPEVIPAVADGEELYENELGGRQR